MFSRLQDQLLALSLAVVRSGGRVDWEEKAADRQQSNFTGNVRISQVCQAGLWITKMHKINSLQGPLGREPVSEGVLKTILRLPGTGSLTIGRSVAKNRPGKLRLSDA